MQGTHESAATTPEFDDILYEVEDSFAVITINRPDSFNSFRSQTVDELIEALTLAWGDNRVRSIILTGSGQKAFCAGGDVKQKAKTGDYGPSRYGMFRISELHKTMRSVPKPIIAAVNGVAIGGGNVLNTLCDITIAATHARFGQAGPKVGSFDAGYGTAFLARVVGEKRAREMWYFCELIDAQKAENWGLANEVVEAEELMPRAKERARALGLKAPTALRFLKQSFNADSEMQTGFTNLAMSALDLYAHSPESHEGAAAFAEKRDPDFSSFDNAY
ncbi:enoyl-CoA hydratase-related protein [Brevibacterium aurantiacum]|uniref:1,4-dihydroxy-2-naphthoyl-CoA synthase n=1 Tax=Brevibacterium aurantiacum TaxID=273384 RepID=A0A2A3YXV5_BREAU|nr:enoyl-CoA hydratase-related protein [Brevibacterium aurantiacum]MDN5587707.1 enoyl-CoA hydratase-related protein [Brevibacterium sp.]MDN6399053.1 enoyl-CoA hydratase-related protein [Brachybacterium sp.]AZL04189.1 1,4-dihydroxy-2-naphthoyl-CoA synthase [Brevibacterium aurantiacum]AZL11397.1 1,4-dihydroxy-2-naphthoyl-CoA synthase [Brevibacterium aurantiacum]AZT95592.1 1,4-dihydroxy-2-naphthoyl-CoA synthase [Brevibacterium aurantiacum]